MGLNPEWGWRSAFRYPIIPMVLMLLLFTVFFKEKPEDVGLVPFVEEDAEISKKEEKISLEIQERGYFYPTKCYSVSLKYYCFA